MTKTQRRSKERRRRSRASIVLSGLVVLVLVVAFSTFGGVSHGARALLHLLIAGSLGVVVGLPARRLDGLGRPLALVIAATGPLLAVAAGLLPMPAILGRILLPGWTTERGEVSWDWVSLNPEATVGAMTEWLLPMGFVLVVGAWAMGNRVPLTRIAAGYLAGLIAVAALHAGGGVTALFGVLPTSLGPAMPFFAPFIDVNHFGSALTLGFPLVVGAALDPRTSRRWVCGALAGAVVVMALWAGSTGPLLVLTLQLAVVVVWSRIVPWFVVGGLAVVGALGVGVYSVAMEGAVDITLHGRLPIWGHSVQMAAEHWSMGTGGGTFGEAIERYRTDSFFHTWSHAHNDWLEWVAETGLLGIVALTGGAVLAWPRRASQSASEEKRSSGRLALLGAVGVLLHSALDFPLHLPALALCVVALWTWRETTIPTTRKSSFRMVRGVAVVLALLQVGGVVWETRAAQVSAYRKVLASAKSSPSSERSAARALSWMAPGSAELLLHRAEAAQLAGSNERATVLLDELEQSYRRDARVLRSISVLRRRMGDTAGAARTAESATRFGPSDWRNWVSLTQALQTTDPFAAGEACRHALVGGPTKVMDLCWNTVPVGVFWVEAVEGESANSQVKVASHVFRQGDAGAALLGFQSARRLDPDLYSPFMADALIELGREREAADFLVLALREHPENVQLLQRMAEVKELEGRWSEAAGLWRRIGERLPMATLREVSALEKAEGPAEALASFDRMRSAGKALSPRELLMKADLERRLGRSAACVLTLSASVGRGSKFARRFEVARGRCGQRGPAEGGR